MKVMHMKQDNTTPRIIPNMTEFGVAEAFVGLPIKQNKL